MRTQQIIRESFGFTGKMKDLKAYLAMVKIIVPTTFRNN